MTADRLRESADAEAADAEALIRAALQVAAAREHLR